jgi:hypothetical protein
LGESEPGHEVRCWLYQNGKSETRISKSESNSESK